MKAPDNEYDRRKCPTLCSNNAAFFKSFEEQLKVWLLKQALCWSFWIRGVGDYNIKLVLVVVEELEAISDIDLDLGVLIGDGHAWDVLLRKTDNSLDIKVGI